MYEVLDLAPTDETPDWSDLGTSLVPLAGATLAFKISVSDAYGHPPLSLGQEPLHIDAAYAARAEEDIALQLSRAGVRLASFLNKALGR
jgi:hypothetical protein